jgi:uncharacterized membrane protein/uncharacterized protein YdeI (BOF family)
MKHYTCAFLTLLSACACNGQISVWTHRYDNARTGAQLNETQLNTSNVNAGSFGKLFSLPVDGSVYAQPLYLPNVPIPSSGTHNVLYVATMNDSVYAFDADTNAGPNAAPLWHVNFTNAAAGVTPVPADDVQTDPNIAGPIGILSTPVIDQGTGTIFVLARTKENGAYIQRLHALNVATGAEKFGGPTVIQGSVHGTAPDAVNGILTFDPKVHNQRTSLALASGNIYIAWASHADGGAYHGWVMAYGATTLQQTAIWNVTPGNAAGGIWQSGAAPAIDAAGNVFYAVGNGSWDGVTNFSESLVKLSPNLKLLDWFTPDNYNALNDNDYDFGNSGPVLIPGTNLTLTGGKQGILYLANTGNLGHIVQGNTQIAQSFLATAAHVHGSPIYWQSPTRGPLVYVWSERDYLRAFHFNGTTLDTTPATQSSFTDPDGMPGGFLSISSNGSAAGTGVLWASTPLTGDGEESVVSGIVRAFDASDLSHLLWSSEMNPARDSIGNFAKFVPPVVVNGKLYMATFSNAVSVYGLLPANSDFHLSTSSSSQTAIAGYTTSYTVNIDATAGAVTFGVTGLPAGATASFRPASISGGGATTLTVATNPATPAGTYQLSVTGTGAFTHSIGLTLNVVNQGGPAGPATDLNIGDPALSGTSTLSGQTYTVSGAGTNIWTESDQFNFNYWALSGDGTITARVRSVTNTSFYAKAGVMLREKLEPDSAFAFAAALPSASAYQYRPGGGDDAAGSPYYPVTYPFWVRLVRANGNFTAYSSPDGTTWTQMGSPVSIDTDQYIYAGLAVTSTNGGALNTAVFDSVSITGPGTTSGTPDFNLQALAPALTLSPGLSGPVGIAMFPRNGFAGQVNLTVTGLPSGASATFSPATLSGSAMSTLNVTASASTPNGVYTLNVTGTSGSLTRIVPVTLDIGPPPDFTLSATPASQSITAGQSAGFTISETPLNDFNPVVNLTVSGLPPGATAILEPGGVNSMVSSNLTIAATAATPAGTYNVTITGAGGGLSHTIPVSLAVGLAPDFSLSATPATRTVQAGFGNTYTIGAAALNTATGTVALSVTGLPAGASAWFDPALVTLGSGSVLTVNTASALAAGTYHLTVTGTSGVLTHTVALTLTVTAAADGTNLDIGTPGLAGSDSLSGGVWTVKGSGTDIWGTSDQFHFVYWTLPGDGTITARVASVTNTSFYAKVGVMMRQSLNANSAYAFAAALPSLSAFQHRTAAGAAGSGSGYYSATYPLWVRVVRANGNLTGYVSADGTAWQQMGNTVSVGLTGSVFAGLAVTSQDNTKLNTAVFDSVSITGPDAASGTADFLIGPNPAIKTVAAGGSGVLTAQVTAENGFTGVVNLSVAGLPAGVTAAFSPASVTGGGASALTISASASAAPGIYSLNLTGASATLTRIIPLALTISAQGTFGLAMSPLSQSSAPGGGAAYTVAVTPQNGFSSTVNLSVSGLPAGASATFSPATIAGSGSSTMTVSVGASTAAGNYNLTITGIGGGVTNTAGVTLVVTASSSPDFSLSATPSTRMVSAGFGSTYAIGTAALNGATGTVTLSVTGLPAGASAWFNPSQVNIGSGSVLTVNTSSALAAGTYNLTLTGTSGALTHTAALTLTVNAAADGTNLDIGTPALAGSASLSAGAWTVKGSGADIWGTSDQFHFDYWTLPGDGTITARVVSVTNTSFYAKAGVMMRQSLSANSAYAFAASLPSLSVFQYRTGTGASASTSGYYGAAYPVWVRVVRANGNLTGYASPDGVTWQKMGNAVSVGLTGTVYAGLAVTSQDNTKLNTAIFDNMSVTGPDATSGTADFLIASSPVALTMTAGGNGAATAQITAENGFAGIVNLSVAGLPTGVTAAFSPASVTGSGSASLTISAAGSTSPGTYSLNLVGTSGALTRIVPLTLLVSAPQPAFSLAATPASQTATPGGSVAYTASVTPQNGFSSAVSLSVSGLPAGVAATFNPASVTGSGSSTMTVTIGASGPTGSYTLTITAAGGGVTKTAAVTLVVSAQPPPDFSLSATPTARTAQAGFGVTYAIGTTALNGATGKVNLTVAGLPAGATSWFNPAQVTLGAGSVLTVNTSSAITPGTYSLTVTGVSGSLIHTAALSLTVSAPADGTYLDIGAPALAGSGSLSGGTWTVKGSGADIWGTSDQFHFDYWTLPGDGTITARVVSVTNTSFYAKAGVMMRQSLNANSAYAFAAALPSTSVYQYRMAAGAPAASSGYYAAAYPVWVRLVRANGNLTAYTSADGAIWQKMGNTVSVGLTGAVYAGLAVTSQDNTKLNTAVFDNVSITGPDTTSATADFLMGFAPAALTVAGGGNGASTAQISAENGFTGVVNLSATGLPAGVTAAFSPASISGGGSSVLTISAGATTARGSYSLNLIGTSGSLTRIAPLALTIN